MALNALVQVAHRCNTIASAYHVRVQRFFVPFQHTPADITFQRVPGTVSEIIQLGAPLMVDLAIGNQPVNHSL